MGRAEEKFVAAQLKSSIGAKSERRRWGQRSHHVDSLSGFSIARLRL